MILCRVLGNTVSTVKHPAFVGQTVLICQPVQADGKTKRSSFLAQDAMGAGVGDLVLCAREGNTARQMLGNDEDPFHAVVAAIVDEVVKGDVATSGPGPQ